MALFKVAHPSPAVGTLIGGDNMIVSATDATDAKAIAASQYSGDSGGWASATVVHTDGAPAA